MGMRRTVDFTRGSIVGNIVAFSMPIVLGELLQNLYNSVDAIVVGNLVGKTALAAVTVGGVIANMVIMFFNGMSVGANVAISKAYGRSDPKVLREKVRMAFTFSLLLGMIGVRQLYLALTLGRAAQPDIRCLYRCYPVGWASTAGLLFVYFLLVRKKLSLPRGSGGHPG